MQLTTVVAPAGPVASVRSKRAVTMKKLRPDPVQYVPAWHRLQLAPVVAPAGPIVSVRSGLGGRQLAQQVAGEIYAA